MSILAPDPPKIPKTTTPSPEEVEAKARKEGRKKRRKIRATQVDTILTSGQGLGGNPQQQSTVLGGG